MPQSNLPSHSDHRFQCRKGRNSIPGRKKTGTPASIPYEELPGLLSYAQICQFEQVYAAAKSQERKAYALTRERFHQFPIRDRWGTPLDVELNVTEKDLRAGKLQLDLIALLLPAAVNMGAVQRRRKSSSSRSKTAKQDTRSSDARKKGTKLFFLKRTVAEFLGIPWWESQLIFDLLPKYLTRKQALQWTGWSKFNLERLTGVVGKEPGRKNRYHKLDLAVLSGFSPALDQAELHRLEARETRPLWKQRIAERLKQLAPP